MKLPNDITIFGDPTYRGECASEDCEQIDFVAWLKFNHPLYHALFIHPKVEGSKSQQQITKDIKMGSFTVGASDLVIPGCPSFVVELKKKNHTKSSISKKQVDYLRLAKLAGSFTGIALGCEAAKEAFELWLTMQQGER